MAVVYAIGDLHIGHRNILKYRTEFASIEEHDQLILDNILSTVSKRDVLYLMGDCFFDAESVDSHLVPIKKHCFAVHWILGNHDTENGVKQDNVRRILAEGLVDKVHGLYKKGGVWFSHAPLHPAELRGCKNIHGHVHSKTIRDPNYFNVSCENVNYKPVNIQQLKEERFRDKILKEYGYPEDHTPRDVFQG